MALPLDSRAIHGPHVVRLENSYVSKLAPYSGMILLVCLIVIFLVRFYVFESVLMPRLYGARYAAMDDTVRRGFVNHHVAGAIKIVLLATAVYPFVSVAFGRSTLHTPLVGSGGRRDGNGNESGSGYDADKHPRHVATMGDMMVVCSQLFIGMYVFELFYRTKVSPVSVLHHVGAILIAQTAVTISMDSQHEVDATIEFVLCFVWGAFDVIAEFLPHVAIILYRIYPTDHAFLARVFRASCFTEIAGTTTETAVVMWLFGSLWSRWTLAFRVTTPILHVVFSVAQLWGAIIFYRMWKWQERLLDEKRMEGEGGEAGSGVPPAATVEAAV